MQRLVLPLLAALATVALAQVQPTQHGVAVTFPDGHAVEIAVEGLLSFRVSAAFDGQAPGPISNPMIEKHTDYAPFKIVTEGTAVGLSTPFGAALIDTVSGAFQLRDANGVNITTSTKFVSYSTQQFAEEQTGEMVHVAKADRLGHDDTCQSVYQNTDASGGSRTPAHPNGINNVQDANGCCSACNADPDCSFWVLDTQGKICYTLQNVVKKVGANNRISGGFTLPGPATITFQLSRNSNARFYGVGGSAGSPLQWTSSNPYVANTQFQMPHFWSTEGYQALSVSQLEYTPNQIANYPAGWTQSSGTAGATTVWTIMGKRADLYLSPAATPYQGMKALWDLTGSARVPPRHAFGFIACRWGWTDSNYVESILAQFRQGQYPADSFIADFEWYTGSPDYSLPSTGSPDFVDFGYNSQVFPNPVSQLQHYRKDLNFRFGGIRKPRLGNSYLITNSTNAGWMLPKGQASVDGDGRNLNYTVAAVRDWYSQNIAHFLSDGVSYWWNDEGETSFFTFYHWNEAQVEALTNYNPKLRFFSINRAYTHGMQKWGAAIWTGDVGVSWDALAQTPMYLLNWGMAGVSYLTCDIGGFNGGDTPADLLTRWYQVGAFIGIFRVHSKLGNTPHFPFLYDANSAANMKKAMVLRYQLLPYLYSLGHDQYRNGRPIFRPLFFEFPQDSNTFSLASQWLVGDGVLAAPVLTQDNNKQVYLPAANWFEWGSAVTHQGPTTLNLNNLGLDKIPVYVRAGTIVPLAPASLQYTDQLPGGPLNVVIYAGQDATFVMYEDDGESLAYETDGAVRATTFSWSESAKTLSWSVSGAFSDSHTFTQMYATVYYTNGSTKSSTTVSIGTGGSVNLA